MRDAHVLYHMRVHITLASGWPTAWPSAENTPTRAPSHGSRKVLPSSSFRHCANASSTGDYIDGDSDPSKYGIPFQRFIDGVTIHRLPVMGRVRFTDFDWDVLRKSIDEHIIFFRKATALSESW